MPSALLSLTDDTMTEKCHKSSPYLANLSLRSSAAFFCVAYGLTWHCQGLRGFHRIMPILRTCKRAFSAYNNHSKVIRWQEFRNKINSTENGYQKIADSLKSESANRVCLEIVVFLYFCQRLKWSWKAK